MKMRRFWTKNAAPCHQQGKQLGRGERVGAGVVELLLLVIISGALVVVVTARCVSIL